MIGYELGENQFHQSVNARVMLIWNEGDLRCGVYNRIEAKVDWIFQKEKKYDWLLFIWNLYMWARATIFLKNAMGKIRHSHSATSHVSKSTLKMWRAISSVIKCRWIGLVRWESKGFSDVDSILVALLPAQTIAMWIVSHEFQTLLSVRWKFSIDNSSSIWLFPTGDASYFSKCAHVFFFLFEWHRWH